MKRTNKIMLINFLRSFCKKLGKLSESQAFSLKNTFYVGNDLNDYEVMKLCGYSVCPSDSHNKIKQIADIVLKTQGGKGVVRELLEDVLKIDLIKVLYK